MTLGRFNTIAVSTTPLQLVGTEGHHAIYIRNLGTKSGSAVVYVSDSSDVGNNATSITINVGEAPPPFTIWGPNGIWVSADTLTEITVLLEPR